MTTSTLEIDAAGAGAPGLSRLARVARRRPVAVVGIEGDDDLAERLRSVGLWAGVVVEIVGAAPFGDPLLVQVHGFRLALRLAEAERVAVREPEPLA